MLNAFLQSYSMSLLQGGVQYSSTATSGSSSSSSIHNSVPVGSGVGGVLGVGTGSIPVSAAIHSGAGGAVTLGTGSLSGTIATPSFVQPITMTTPSTLQSPTLTVSTLNPAQVSFFFS